MISIIIPTYNEEKAIDEVITEIRNILYKRKKYFSSEIIIVNDGSTDNTKKIVQKIIKDKKQSIKVRLVNNPQNMGYGYSIKRGIEEANNETIVIIDADLTYPFSYVYELLDKKNEGYDLVVSRRIGKYYKGGIIKRFFRFQLRKFVEFISNKKVLDINSGFRVFDKSTVIKYFPRLCDTFSFTTSQTLNYVMNAKTVGYVDILYNKRCGKSKVKFLKDSLITMRYIIECCIYYSPLKMFSILSFLCIILSIIGFVLSHFAELNIGYILGVGGFFTSIIVFALGLLAVLLKQIMNK